MLIHILIKKKEPKETDRNRKKLKQLGVPIFHPVGSYVSRTPPLWQGGSWKEKLIKEIIICHKKTDPNKQQFFQNYLPPIKYS